MYLLFLALLGHPEVQAFLYPVGLELREVLLDLADRLIQLQVILYLHDLHGHPWHQKVLEVQAFRVDQDSLFVLAHHLHQDHLEKSIFACCGKCKVRIHSSHLFTRSFRGMIMQSILKPCNSLLY